MRLNQVFLHDGHINIFYQPPRVKFADVIPGPIWIGNPLIKERMISYDNGKTFKKERDELIFGAYFFLSDDMVNHYRVVYNIINLLAEFGGLNSVLFVAYQFLGKRITKNIIVAKFIRSLFFVPCEKDDENQNMRLKSIRLKFADKFETLHWLKRKLGLNNNGDQYNHDLY